MDTDGRMDEWTDRPAPSVMYHWHQIDIYQ